MSDLKKAVKISLNAKEKMSYAIGDAIDASINVGYYIGVEDERTRIYEELERLLSGETLESVLMVLRKGEANVSRD